MIWHKFSHFFGSFYTLKKLMTICFLKGMGTGCDLPIPQNPRDVFYKRMSSWLVFHISPKPDMLIRKFNEKTLATASCVLGVQKVF